MRVMCLAVATAGVAPLLAHAAPAGSGTVRAVVVIGTTPTESSDAAVARLEILGFKTEHIFAPCVLIGRLSTKTQAIMDHAQELGIRAVSTKAVSTPSAFVDLGSDAVFGIETWNSVFSPGGLLSSESLQKARKNAPKLPFPEVLKSMPTIDATLTATLFHIGGSPPFGAAPVDTSEYMLGGRLKAKTIVVSVFFPASNPASPGHSEDWTGTEKADAYFQVVAAMDWWVQAAPACAHLRFAYQKPFAPFPLTEVDVPVEPINTPSTDDGLWIDPIMDSLGFGAYPDYVSKLVAYTHGIRTLPAPAGFDADWAFCVFVVDDSADADGRFPDGPAAYSMLGGPYIVVPIRNGYTDAKGNPAFYSTLQMDFVTAHETGHIFYAVDEYAGGVTGPSFVSGYLAIQNDNHVSSGLPGVDCIMRSSYQAFDDQRTGAGNGICTPTRHAIGWRDLSGNGVFDILDVSPTVSLTTHFPEPDPSPFPGFNAVAQVGLLDNLNPVPRSFNHPINVDTVVGVDHRVNGGAWGAAFAWDGLWNGGAEACYFVPDVVPCGINLFEAKAKVEPCGGTVIEQAPPYASYQLERNCGAATPVTDSCGLALLCTQPDDRRGGANDVAVDANGDFYVAGWVDGHNWTDPDNRWHVEKYTVSGDTCTREPAWGDGFSPVWSTASAVAIDQAGNIFVGGERTDATTGVDWLVIRKYSSTGVFLAQYEYFPPTTPFTFIVGSLNDIAIDANGNVIFVGSEQGSDATPPYAAFYDRWVIGVLDNNLNPINVWQEEFGVDARAQGVVTEPGGKFYVAGSYTEASGNTKGRVAKYDLSGPAVIDSIEFDGPATSIQRESTGNLVVGTGVGTSYGEVRIRRLTPSLNLVTDMFGSYGTPFALAIESCGNIAMVGIIGEPTRRDWLMERFDPTGFRITRQTFSNPTAATFGIGPDDSEDWARSVAFDNTGAMIVVGWEGVFGNFHSVRWRVRRYRVRESIEVSCAIMPPGPKSVGSIFDLVITVSNTGTTTLPELVSLFSVTGPGGATLQAGPATATLSLPSGITSAFTWTFVATTLGAMTFSATVQGLSPSPCLCSGTAVQGSCLSSLIILPAMATTFVDPADWPQYHHDPAHAGTASTFVCSSLELVWSRTLGPRSEDFNFAGVAVAGGRIFAGTMNGTLRVFDEATGNPSWSFPSGQSIEHTPAVVTYPGLSVVVISTATGLAGLDGATGTLLWTVTLSGGMRYGSPVVVGGNVFAFSLNGEAVSVVAVNGLENWRSSVVGPIVDSSAAYGNGFLYVMRRESGPGLRVVKVDASTGALSGTSAAAYTGDLTFGPTFASGMIGLGTNRGLLVWLDAGSLAEICQSPTRPPLIYSSMAVDGGIFFVGSADGTGVGGTFEQGGSGANLSLGLHSAPIGTCDPLLTLLSTGTADVFSPPAVVAGDGVFVGADHTRGNVDAQIYGVNRTGGAFFNWPVPSGVKLRGAPAIARGRVYFPAVVGDLSGNGEHVLLAFGPTPPRPTGLTAITICGGVALSWGSQDICGLGISGYQVFRATSPGGTCTGVPLVLAGVTTYLDSTTAAGTVYWYQVQAIASDGGTAGCSTAVSIVGVGGSSAPVLLSTSATAGGVVDLTWASPGVLCTICTAYEVYRTTMPGMVPVLIGTTLSASAFSDPNPAYGFTNCYTVVCLRTGGGPSATSNELCVDVPHLCAGFDIAALPIQQCRVILCWDAASCPPNVTGYRLYRSTFAGVPLVNPISGTLLLAASCYEDSDVTVGMTYHYVVCAVTDLGVEVGCADELPVTVIETLNPPQLASVIANVDGTVSLGWTPPDACAHSCSAYAIYRSTIPGLLGTLIAVIDVNATSFVDAAPVTASDNCYVIICLDDEGRQRASTQYCLFVPDACPGDFSAILDTQGTCQVSLCWIAANCGPDVTSYTIFRASYAGVQLTTPYLQGSAFTTTCAMDSNVTAGETYYYRLCLYADSGALLGCSSEVSITVTKFTVPPAVASIIIQPTGEVVVGWVPPPSHPCVVSCSTYTVYRSTTPGILGMPIGTVGPATTIFVDFSPIVGPSNCYTVICDTDAGAANASPQTCIPYPPLTANCPSLFSATAISDPVCGIRLCWDGASCGVPVTGFFIYRATAPGMALGAPLSGTTLVTGSCFDDFTITTGETYYYRICAVVADGSIYGCSTELVSSGTGVHVGPELQDVVLNPDGSLSLTWSPPVPRCDEPCTEYAIYRATWPGISGELIATITPSTTFFSDGPPRPDVFNCYSMCCYDPLHPCPPHLCEFVPCIPPGSSAWTVENKDELGTRFLPANGPVNNAFGLSFVSSNTIDAQPVQNSSGLTIVGDLGGTVYVLNPDATLRCAYQVGGAIRFAASIDESASLFAVGSDDGYIYLFNFDCTLVSSIRVGSPLTSGVNIVCDGFSFGYDDWMGVGGGGLGDGWGGGAVPLPGGPGYNRYRPARGFLLGGGGLYRWRGRKMWGPGWGAPRGVPSLKGAPPITWRSWVRGGFLLPDADCIIKVDLDGNLIWRTTADHPPVIRGCELYTSVGNVIRVLDCTSGTVMEDIPCDDDIIGPGIGQGDQVYFPGSHSLIRLDLRSRLTATVFDFPLGNGMQMSAARIRSGRDFYLLWCVIDGNLVQFIPARPGAPQNANLFYLNNFVAVSWTPPVQSSSSRGILGYNIYRSFAVGSFSAVPLNAAPLTGSIFVDLGVAQGATAYYIIQAVDLDGNTSPDSTILSTVQGQVAASLVLKVPAHVVSGLPFDLTVTAINVDGTLNQNFVGTVEFQSTNPGSSLPPAYTFQLADAGCRTFSATMMTVGMSQLLVSLSGGFGGTLSESSLEVLPTPEVVSLLPSSPPLLPSEFDFFSPTDGWLTGLVSGVADMPLAMHLGGSLWTRVSVSLAHCFPYLGKALSLVDANDGWFDGWGTTCDTNETVGVRYRLQGGAWQPEESAPAGHIPFDTFSLKMVAQDDGWEALVGAGPTPGTEEFHVYRYNGREWRPFQTIGSEGLARFTFVPGQSREGWALGPQNQPWHFAKNQWAADSSYSALGGLLSIHMNSPSDVWAVGPAAKIVHYDGNGWTQIAPPPAVASADFSYVHFFDPNHGVIVGGMSLGVHPWFTAVVLYFDAGTWRWLDVSGVPGLGDASPFKVKMVSHNEGWVGLYTRSDLLHLRIPDGPPACGSSVLPLNAMSPLAAEANPLKITSFSVTKNVDGTAASVRWESSRPARATLRIEAQGSSTVIRADSVAASSGEAVWHIPSRDNVTEPAVQYTVILTLEQNGERAGDVRTFVVARRNQRHYIVGMVPDGSPRGSRKSSVPR